MSFLQLIFPIFTFFHILFFAFSIKLGEKVKTTQGSTANIYECIFFVFLLRQRSDTWSGYITGVIVAFVQSPNISA